MNKLLLSVLIITMSLLTAEAQKLPSKESVLSAMELANKHFLDANPDPGKPTFVKKMRPSNLWTRGVYFEGLCALVDCEKQSQSAQLAGNMKYMVDWATFHKWTPRNGIKTRDADDYCCCQTYLYLVEQGVEGASMQPTIQCMDNLLSINESLNDWTWIDAIQMGLPVMTRLSRIKALAGESDAERYAEQGWKMYEWARNTLAGGLFNEADGLWWRDKDFVPPYAEPNGEDCYWSRGNGWVYAAYVRALENAMLESADGTWKQLPYEKHFDQYKRDYVMMSEALLKCQRKDKFWNVSLHDDSNFGGKELTGTSLFIYGMAWGIRHGILDRKVYLPVVVKTWKAMVKECLHTDGFLGYVQGTGKEPKDSQPVNYTHEPDFDDFGLGCFLLAGSEVYKLK